MKAQAPEDHALTIEQVAGRLQIAQATADQWLRRPLSTGIAPDRALTLDEAAARLQVAPTTMKRWLRRHRVPA